jgi:hypothetical protein
MRRSVQSITALTLLAVAVPAAAYVRETTEPGHPESGHCLWRRGRTMTYRVNAAAISATGCQTAVAAEAAADVGFDAWGAATCTDFAFAKATPATTTATAVGKDGVNLVVVRTKLCSDVVGTDSCAGSSNAHACAAKFNCWNDDYGTSTIGLTTTSFDRFTGEILDADIELFAWDGALPAFGHYFTCADSPPACTAYPGCSNVDLAAVVTHEAGHMLGLDHVCDASFVAPYDLCPSGEPAIEVMAPQTGNIARRALAADDIEGVCTIYPAGRATLTCAPPAPPESGGGCSSTAGAGVWTALAAAALSRLLAIRRRKAPSKG